MKPASPWPKRFPPLTDEQQRISDDFMRYWHEVLPKRYGKVDEFNHRYVVRHRPASFRTTLEIGAGNGEHLNYEVLSEVQTKNYVALDIRESMLQELRRRHPLVQSVVGDCQVRIDFPDEHFDRIVAVHVLEHLPDLPKAVAEIHRLTNRSRGVLSIVIPCEGSLAYSVARRMSAQRLFERRYGQPYAWFIEREHINKPYEIFRELNPYFEIVHRTYFPIGLPFEFCNLCIGAVLKPLQPSD